jgi:putative transposase
VVYFFPQANRDGAAAKRFFKRLLRSHGGEARRIVTEKSHSYGVAHRELILETMHGTKQYENNRAEQSHEATGVRERGMRNLRGRPRRHCLFSSARKQALHRTTSTDASAW